MKAALLRAIKGEVLICEKAERPGRITVRVAAVPKLSASAKTFREAEELLVEKIWEICDLDEPVAFRYDNLQEEGGEGRSIIQIAVNEVADVTNPERYFENGFCSTCQSGLGRRNSELLQLVSAPKSSLAGVSVRFQPYLKCGLRVHMTVLNAGLCKQLAPHEDLPIKFQKVCVNGKPLAGFYEVVPTRILPCAIPISRKGRVGGRCEKCSAEFIYHEPTGKFLSNVDADVIRAHGTAMIDSFSDPILCVTSKVWKKIKNTKLGRGLIDRQIFELEEKKISTKPKLEKIKPFRL